jgi:hypothetical protein
MKRHFEKLSLHRLAEKLPPGLNQYLALLGLVGKRDSSAAAGGDPDRT